MHSPSWPVEEWNYIMRNFSQQWHATRKLHCTIFGANGTLPPRITQCKLGGQCLDRFVQFLEGRNIIHFWKWVVLSRQGTARAKIAQFSQRATENMRSLNAWWYEWKQQLVIIQAIKKCRIQKMGKHACGWIESFQWCPSMQNNVMHVIRVRCKWKLKWC